MFNELVVNAKNGDKNSMEDILVKLQPLIYSSIKKYYYKPLEMQDLVQDGNITIIQSVMDFDFTLGVPFLGYIKSRLKFLYLNKHKERSHISLNQPIKDEEGEMIDLLIGEDENSLDLLIKEENIKEIKIALDSLTPRQRQIIILYYIKRMNISEVASFLGISYRTVVNTKTKAIEVMRNILNMQ